MFRIKLCLEATAPQPDCPKAMWMVVDPSTAASVQDLVRLIRKRNGLRRGHGLFLDDAWLPPDESIQVLRDGDFVRVVHIGKTRESAAKKWSKGNESSHVKRQPQLAGELATMVCMNYEKDGATPSPKKRCHNKQAAAACDDPFSTNMLSSPPKGTSPPDLKWLQQHQEGNTKESCSNNESDSVEEIPAKTKPTLDQAIPRCPVPAKLNLDNSFTIESAKKKRKKRRKKKTACLDVSEVLTPAHQSVFVPPRVRVEPSGKHLHFDGEEEDSKTNVKEETNVPATSGPPEVTPPEALPPNSVPVLHMSPTFKGSQLPQALPKGNCNTTPQHLPTWKGNNRGGCSYAAVPPPYAGVTSRTAQEQKTEATPESTAVGGARADEKCYASYPKLKTPPRTGDLIAFKVRTIIHC